MVGPKADEIHTDEFGRVKVQFHWDRYGKLDGDSSCWIRVAQPWAGKGWGAIQIPRIGQEVVVSFLEGDPDRPIVVGSVYNGANKPPYTLPDNKTQSGLKTRSSLQGTGDNCNEIRFEDKKGAEQLFIHAEKNQDIEVENDESHSVGNDRKKDIKHDETVTVGNDRKKEVKHDETLTIGNDRKKDVKHDETVTVGNDRTESVTANEQHQDQPRPGRNHRRQADPQCQQGSRHRRRRQPAPQRRADAHHRRRRLDHHHHRQCQHLDAQGRHDRHQGPQHQHRWQRQDQHQGRWRRGGEGQPRY